MFRVTGLSRVLFLALCGAFGAFAPALAFNRGGDCTEWFSNWPNATNELGTRCVCATATLYQVTDDGDEVIETQTECQQMLGNSEPFSVGGSWTTAPTTGTFKIVVDVTGYSDCSSSTPVSSSPDTRSPNPTFECVELATSPPGITIEKSADPNPTSPGETVTYTYVVTNIGSSALTNVVVVDDNGTPGSTGDDFTVGSVASLAAGASVTFTHALDLPVTMCMEIDGADTEIGTLEVEQLANGDFRARYTQSRDLNDNTYGAAQYLSAGWSSHSFNNLTGSDRCEFRFRDGSGNVVFDAELDYISQSSSYASGYGSLGISGGDGDLISGSASSLIDYSTSLSDTINQPQFATPAGAFTTHSPPESPPGVSTPAGWDYVNWYEVIVDGALFAANGFGGVEVPYVHNSPSKKGFNLATPASCGGDEVTNIATVTASFAIAGGGTGTVSASASATVTIGTPNDCATTGATPTFSGRTMSTSLTNTGGGTCSIESLTFAWPTDATHNKKLKKIQLGGKTIWEGGTFTGANPASVTISAFKGTLADRSIDGGVTKTLKFEWEANSITTASSYHLSIDFGGGLEVFLP